MKKIYSINFDNGEEYAEDRSFYTFKYSYSSREKAENAIEELKKDEDYLADYVLDRDQIQYIDFWIIETELVD